MTRPKRLKRIMEIVRLVEVYNYTPGLGVIHLAREELGALANDVYQVFNKKEEIN